MRIDKFISNNTSLSRKEVRILVSKGQVSLNDQLVKDSGLKINSPNDVVFIDGRPIFAIGLVYYMLHKPEGYVCANTDSLHPTVLQLISEKQRCTDGRPIENPEILRQLQIVGRLDLDTTGFVLLTNNSDWNHRITSPKSCCIKTYHVTLDTTPSPYAAKIFAEGILLEGENKKTKPAGFSPISNTTARVSIQEGKYHQVKKMFASIGNRVTKLHREAIGPLSLDPKLQPGQYRALLPKEIKALARSLSLSDIEKMD